MFHFLFYLSYAMTIYYNVPYQPFVDYLHYLNDKYDNILRFPVDSNMAVINDMINSYLDTYYNVVIGLMCLSFWIGSFASLASFMMLPLHLIGTWVAYNQITNSQPDVDYTVDICNFKLNLILSTINLYFLSTIFF